MRDRLDLGKVGLPPILAHVPARQRRDIEVDRAEARGQHPAFAMRGVAPVVRHAQLTWRRGLLGGIGSVASYGLALYAMTRAPIAAVAALRETSILFALVISVLILKERASPWRYVAGGMIAIGALTMKLG